MSDHPPKILLAGEREAGAACVHCGRDIAIADATALCSTCGAVHHLSCWQTLHGCGAYECPESRARVARSDLPVLSISAADLAEAVPLPAAPIRSFASEEPIPDRPRNKLAVWAFVVALLGIPLFGIVTGLIAIVIACIALVGHSPRRRGLGFAVAAMLIGVFDVIGWGVGLAMYMGGGGTGVSMAELTIDPDSLKDLPERIARAMRANVLIQADFGLAGAGIGSGVILRVEDDLAYIVTNRHVIDHHFKDLASEDPVDLGDIAPLTVMTVGETQVPATVEWVAPHGVDLAIISAHVGGDLGEVREARWNIDERPQVGDPVFAIGNPHGLGWTHSAGSVSQIRSRQRGLYTFKILQSTAALNPGNSGGGLYDAEGQLVGINTMTGDKRVAEGLGFSISIPTLMELAPESFELPATNTTGAVNSDKGEAGDGAEAAKEVADEEDGAKEGVDLPQAIGDGER